MTEDTSNIESDVLRHFEPSVQRVYEKFDIMIFKDVTHYGTDRLSATSEVEKS